MAMDILRVFPFWFSIAMSNYQKENDWTRSMFLPKSRYQISSGQRLHSYGKSNVVIGKAHELSMAMSNSYVQLAEGNTKHHQNPKKKRMEFTQSGWVKSYQDKTFPPSHLSVVPPCNATAKVTVSGPVNGPLTTAIASEVDVDLGWFGQGQSDRSISIMGSMNIS